MSDKADRTETQASYEVGRADGGDAMSKRPAKAQWILKVQNGRAHDRLLHRLKLFPSQFKANEYVGFYALSAEPLLRSHIEKLKAIGLHCRAKIIKDRRPTPSFKRKAKRPAAAPDTEIINLQIAKENRLAADALKLAIEQRRQAEQAAQREANARAKQALLRAKGEM